MNKEALLALGLTTEQADKVMAEHSKTLDGNYIPKHRFDEVTTELKDVKKSVADRDAQITGLKKFEGDAQALATQIKTLEDANKQASDDYNAKLTQERLKNAVKLSLLNDETGKPHDADMVLGLFDLNSIKLDEATGKILTGFKEQHDNIKKEKAFLFNVVTPTNTDPKNPGFKPVGKTPEDGNKNPGDGVVDYGKNLAKVRLEMSGVKAPTSTDPK